MRNTIVLAAVAALLTALPMAAAADDLAGWEGRAGEAYLAPVNGSSPIPSDGWTGRAADG